MSIKTTEALKNLLSQNGGLASLFNFNEIDLKTMLDSVDGEINKDNVIELLKFINPELYKLVKHDTPKKTQEKPVQNSFINKLQQEQPALADLINKGKLKVVSMEDLLKPGNILDPNEECKCNECNPDNNTSIKEEKLDKLPVYTKDTSGSLELLIEELGGSQDYKGTLMTIIQNYINQENEKRFKIEEENHKNAPFNDRVVMTMNKFLRDQAQAHFDIVTGISNNTINDINRIKMNILLDIQNDIIAIKNELTIFALTGILGYTSELCFSEIKYAYNLIEEECVELSEFVMGIGDVLFSFTK